MLLVFYSGSCLLHHCVQSFSLFSLLSDAVCSLMLVSLIHLDLNFVLLDKYGSICNLLHIDFQLDKYHLLKMFSISVVYFWHSFQKSAVHMNVDLCLGLWFYSINHHVSFYVIPCDFYYCSSVIQVEISDGDASRTSFIFQDCSSYSVCLFVCFSI